MDRRFHGSDQHPGGKRRGTREEATEYVRTHLREHPSLQPHRGRWRLQIRSSDDAITARLTRGALTFSSERRSGSRGWWVPERCGHTLESRYENVVQGLAAGLLRWLRTFGEADEEGWLRVAVWRDPEHDRRYHLAPIEGISRTVLLLAPGIVVAQAPADPGAVVHRLHGDQLQVAGTVATALDAGLAQVVK